jgi:hypothetical protein
LPNELRFPFPQNNYEDLRDANAAVPKILVVVQVPDDDPALWLVSRAEGLELYRPRGGFHCPDFQQINAGNTAKSGYSHPMGY